MLLAIGGRLHVNGAFRSVLICCRNVSHSQQQSYSGLRSPVRSCFTYLRNIFSVDQLLLKLTHLLVDSVATVWTGRGKSEKRRKRLGSRIGARGRREGNSFLASPSRSWAPSFSLLFPLLTSAMQGSLYCDFYINLTSTSNWGCY